MALRETFTTALKESMKAGNQRRLSTVRMILAGIKQREVDERVSLDDTQVLAVIDKMVKQRKESIAQFAAGGRADLVEKEKAEIALLQEYLPAQLSPAEIEALISVAIATTGAVSLKDMGKVMGALKSELAGRADMGVVSARIKQKLA